MMGYTKFQITNLELLFIFYISMLFGVFDIINILNISVLGVLYTCRHRNIFKIDL